MLLLERPWEEVRKCFAPGESLAARRFARGLQEILVVEEKRQITAPSAAMS